MRRCSNCKKYKKLLEFSKDSKTKDGIRLACKECCNNYYKQYYKKYSNRLKEKSKKYRIKNKEKIKDCITNWYKLNTEHVKDYNKQYKQLHKKELKEHYINTKEKQLKKRKEYRIKNKEKIKKYRKSRKEIRRLYLKVNKKRILKVANIYRRNKYNTDTNFKIANNLRGRLYKALKGINKIKATLELLGCSISQLKKHLENKFTKGMNWGNYGLYGWHIDHIRPCCTFDLSKPEEQKACFHYTNLQPLWWKTNIRKGHKYER